MNILVYLMVFLWILAIPSVSSGDDVSRLPNFDTQTKCAIYELPSEEKTWFPWELIKHKDYKGIYFALIAREHLEEGWLSSLSGPAPKSRLLSIEGREFLYAQSCKPHNCKSHVIHLLFSRQEMHIYGLLIEDDLTVWLGKPSGCIKEALGIFVRK